MNCAVDILLSLVRTHALGHLRQINRWIVALSRARLGLYVFGRKSLFESAPELAPALKLLLSMPTQLHLLPSETFPTDRAIVRPGMQNVLIGFLTCYLERQACPESSGR